MLNKFLLPALFTINHRSFLFGKFRLESGTAFVANAVNQAQIFDPLVEFFFNSAKRAFAREREISLAEKFKLHRNNPVPALASGAFYSLVQNRIRRVFDVVG